MIQRLTIDEYYSIAYLDHTIMNPLRAETVREIGRMCRLTSSSRVLDIGSGKGYVCCELTEAFGVHSVQVDISEQWITRARELFEGKGISAKTNFVQLDAREYTVPPKSFDLIICLGNSPLFGGFSGMLDALLPGLRSGGKLLAGEAVADSVVPIDYQEYLDDLEWRIPAGEDVFDTIEEHNCRMTYMRRSTTDEWDEYMSLQWKAITGHLERYPQYKHKGEMTEWMLDEQEIYLRYQMRYVDWCVMLLQKA